MTNEEQNVASDPVQLTEHVLPWRIEMLGGLQARQGDLVVSKFPTQKTGAVLAYLALSDRLIATRRKLSATIWSDGDATALRNRLNQAVSSLRRQLEAPGSGAGRVFISDHQYLRLDPGTVTTDVAEFEALINEADTAERTERTRLLEMAVGLYHGPLLEGYYEPWIGPRRTQLHTAFKESLRQLVKIHHAEGHFAVAAEHAHRLASVDPADEAAHRDVVENLVACNRVQAAKRHAEFMKATLESLGVTPEPFSPETLSRLESTNGAAPVKPGPMEIPLTALRQPLGPRSGTVPRGIHRLVGRDDEMSALQRLVLDEGARVVTVMGIGGSGKSRLAIELAQSLLFRMEDRVFFVPLHMSAGRGGVIAQISAVVCPELSPERRTWHALKERLDGQRRSLVILDTAETVTSTDLDDLGRLVDECHGLQLLVTSRRPTHIAGEVQFALGPLPVPVDVGAPVEEIAENASVQLFVQRAQATKPDFQVTERNAAAIAQICVELEGLPLSLELAAGWARSMSPAQMLERLSQRLDFLESRRRDIGQRHRAIRAVLDSTVSLVSPALREAFLRLAVFNGGFTHCTAARLCPDIDIEAALDELMESSLITTSREPGDGIRFDILETLRDYALEQMPPDLAEETGMLHADCFLDVVEGKTLADRAHREDDWLELVTVEYPNVESAMRHFRSKHEVEQFARTAIALVPFWESTIRITEGCDWLESALDLLPDDHVLVTSCLTGVARLAWHKGDTERAKLCAGQALTRARQQQDPLVLMEALLEIQLQHHNIGDYDTSKSLAREGLDLAQSLSNWGAVSRWHLRLGNTAVEERQFEEARKEYELSLETGRLAHDSTRVASALTNLGHLAVRTGHPDLARVSLLEAIDLSRTTGVGFAIGSALANMARVEVMSGSPKAGFKWLVEALRSTEEKKHVHRDVLEAAAELAAALEDYEPCAQLLGATLGLYTQHYLGGIIGESRLRLESAAQDALGDERYREMFLIGRQMTQQAADALVHHLAERHGE